MVLYVSTTAGLFFASLPPRKLFLPTAVKVSCTSAIASSALCYRHQKDSAMARSIRHSGVIRAAISLDLSGPCVSDVVQLLTTGKAPSVRGACVRGYGHRMQKHTVDILMPRECCSR